MLEATTIRDEAGRSPTGGEGAFAAAAHVRDLAATFFRRLPRISLVFVVGFAAGAVFWHAVGFWSFVSAIVLKGPVPALSAGAPGDITTGSIGPIPPAHRRTTAAGVDVTCTALALDRRTGETTPSLCTPRDVRWNKGARQGKTDRLTTAAEALAWPARPVP